MAELVRTRLGLCCTGAREDCAPTEVPWTPAAGRTGVKCRPGWGAFGAKQLGFQVWEPHYASNGQKKHDISLRWWSWSTMRHDGQVWLWMDEKSATMIKWSMFLVNYMGMMVVNGQLLNSLYYTIRQAKLAIGNHRTKRTFSRQNHRTTWVCFHCYA